MTVAAAGRFEGVLREVTREAKLGPDQPEIELSAKAGRINADLTVGVDVTCSRTAQGERRISFSRRETSWSDGFIVTPQEAVHLGLGKRPGIRKTHSRISATGAILRRFRAV